MSAPAGTERPAPEAGTAAAPPDGGPQAVAAAGGLPAAVDLVEQPATLIRIGSMIKQLLGEVRADQLDEASRNRLRAVHAASIRELKTGLSAELCAELDRLALPFGDSRVPSAAELRIAQAQLIGWLEGVFHGIQMALFLEHLSARAQLDGIRTALPPQQLEFPPGDGTYL